MAKHLLISLLELKGVYAIETQAKNHILLSILKESLFLCGVN